MMQTHINPTTHLLNNLSLAIDEAELVLTITSLSNKLYSLEQSSTDPKRIQPINREIQALEHHLSVIRSKANFGMDALR